MSKTITLVAGVKTQAMHPSPAAELYLSRWFRLARAYAEAQGPWLILSAKRGVLEPTEVVEPYGETGRNVRPGWGAATARNLLERTEPEDILRLLSVATYGETLLAPLRAERQIELPTEGLTLDQQVAWLEAELQALGVEVPGPRERTPEEKAARRARRAARR